MANDNRLMVFFSKIRYDEDLSWEAKDFATLYVNCSARMRELLKPSAIRIYDAMKDDSG